MSGEGKKGGEVERREDNGLRTNFLVGRLVRRMVSASKLGHLAALHRFKIGSVSLPSLGISLSLSLSLLSFLFFVSFSLFFPFLPHQDLKPGEWGQLEEQQVESLWEEIGGRERVVERKVEALKQQARRMREINRPSLRLEEWLEKNQ